MLELLEIWRTEDSPECFPASGGMAGDTDETRGDA